MNGLRVRVLGMATTLWAVGLGAASDSSDAKGAAWHTDYARARAIARTTSRPLCVVFRCRH
jgi:hypothetical protein